MNSGMKSTGQSKEDKKNVRTRDSADNDQQKFLDVIDTIETVNDAIESGYRSTSAPEQISSGAVIRGHQGYRMIFS